MTAWLTIDHAAKRYGVLPSKLMQSGDSIDLRCAEIAVGYELFVKKNPGIKTNHGFSQEQLQAAIEKARKINDEKN